MESGSLPPIHSIQNPRIKHAIRLRSARARRKAGEFLIDGENEIARAMAAGVHLKSLFVSPQAISSDRFPKCDCLQLVSEQVLQKLSYGDHASSPVAVAATPDLPLSDIQLTSSSLVLVLDQTEKPGNLGACFRTASACGIDAVILTSPVCELFNPNAIRSSRGAVFSLPVALSTATEFLAYAREVDLPVLAARVDGQSDLWECDLKSGSAVVFGSEARGLGEEWSGDSVASFRIPMNDRVDSLNVSISAAVTLYEAIRQRRDTKFDALPGDV